jgi:hypothetical protein
MKPFPETPEFLKAAERIVWFKSPRDALQQPVQLMAYAMKHATAADMDLLLREIGPEGLVEAIDNAPPGIIDPRSWAYWNARIGRYPTPPLPTRRLPAA